MARRERIQTGKQPHFNIGYYFAERHGLMKTVKEGINYTRDSLVIPHHLADLITSEIVKKTPYKPLSIVDGYAGIGLQTLSFLDNPNVALVISHEGRDNLKKMLETNIKLYDLSSKSIILGEFNGVDSQYGGAVVYFDNDLAIGRWEKFMPSLKHCSLIVVKTKPEVVPANFDGYKKETRQKKTYNLTFYESPEGMKKALENFSAISSEGLPDEQWLHELQRHLDDILAKIISNSTERAKYLEEKPIETWAKAFIGSSVDPFFNYEALEFKGDHMLKAAFTEYLFSRFPDITNRELTEINRKYMSEEYQASLTRQLGLSRFIRLGGIPLTRRILGDVFESFVGALATVSNQVVGSPAGFANVKNLIIKLFENVKIDPKLALGPEKSQIKEIFEGLGWAKEVPERKVDVDNGIKIIVELNDTAVKYLANRDIKIGTMVLGEATARNKDVAESKAFGQALQTLRSYGVTKEWVEEEKFKTEFARSEYLPYIEAAKKRLKEEGYLKMYFHSPKIGVEGHFVQLIGVTEIEEQHLLATGLADTLIEARRKALEKFALKKQ